MSIGYFRETHTEVREMTLPTTADAEIEVWIIWCVKPPTPGTVVRAKYSHENRGWLAEVCPKGCCVWHLAFEETMALPDLWQEIPEGEGR